MSELERAKQHVAAALEKSNAASAAVRAAEEEEVRLAGVLAAALQAEREAAENGKPTAAFTAKVRDAQDAARLHGYRIKKLETDAAMAQSEYTDRFRVLQTVELAVAHVEAGAAADAFEAALTAAAEAKRKYLDALGSVRGLTDETLNYSPDNIARVVRWSVTLHLLPEMCGGKDYNGKPIESAADIRQQISMDRMPLLR